MPKHNRCHGMENMDWLNVMNADRQAWVLVI